MSVIAITRGDGNYSWCLCQPGVDPEAEVVRISKDIPSGYVAHAVMPAGSLPARWTFVEAWEPVGITVATNILKAKDLCHRVRRAKRDEELAPLDKLIASQIPGTNPAQVEQQRQVIRDKYAVVQTQIDSAPDVDALYAILDTLK